MMLEMFILNLCCTSQGYHTSLVSKTCEIILYVLSKAFNFWRTAVDDIKNVLDFIFLTDNFVLITSDYEQP